MPGDAGGCTALADDLHIVKTSLCQQIRRGLGAALHLTAAGRVGPHRFDAYQRLQITANRWQYLADAFDEIAHDLEVSGISATPIDASAKNERRIQAQGNKSALTSIS